MKKIFTLLTLALMSIGTAWGTDYTLGASTFNSGKNIATVNDVEFTLSKAHGGGGQTGYTEYIKFSANATYTITLPEGFVLTNVNVKGYTNKDGKSDGSFKVGESASQTLPARNDKNLSTNVAITDGYDYPISQTGGSVTISTDGSGNQICVLITITGTAPAAVAVDPVFSLSSTTISTSQTGQIKVGTKDDLDGIKLSSITYGTSGIVTVDEDGEITPVTAGTTTINFNSGAVTNKYNASTGNSLTITVVKPVTVFEVTDPNTEFVLSKTNIQTAGNEFVTTSTEDWSNRKPTGYSETDYYNLNGTSRYITFKVSGASTFQIVIQNASGSDRKYTVKIGDGDSEDIVATNNTTNTSKVFATGTTDEVTIVVTGTSDGSLYPIAFKFNPVVTASIDPTYEWATFCSDYALDFSGVSGLKAYMVIGHVGTTITKKQVTGTVPAGTGLLLNGATASIPVVANSSTHVSANLLKAGTGSAVSYEAGKTKYVLGDEGGKAQFLKIVDGTPATVPVGKAYLEFNDVIESRNLDIDGDVTAIKNIKVGTEDNVYYDLQGRRVLYPTKGLYIVNGKKVLVP